MTSEYINIIYITDERYIIPTRISIKSLVKHTSDGANYRINILSTNFPSIKRHFNDIEFPDNVSMNFIEAGSEDYWQKIENHDYVSKSALLKFRLPEIFSDIERAIYVDCDTLFAGDVKELSQINIRNYYAAVVRDMATELSGHDIKSVNRKYFNSGVMLLNLELMRAHHISSKLTAYKISELSHAFMDQDAFNNVLEDVYYVSMKFNYISDIRNKYEEEKILGFYGEQYCRYSEALIIHMAGARKPWNDVESNEFDNWSQYLDKNYEFAFCIKNYFGKLKAIEEQCSNLFSVISNYKEQNERLANDTQEKVDNLQKELLIVKKKLASKSILHVLYSRIRHKGE